MDTTKRHAKRLLKVLKEDLSLQLPTNFKLAHSQEILSKSLGFNNWHELSETFKEQKNVANSQQFSDDDDISIIKRHIIATLKLSDNDEYYYRHEENENREKTIHISFDEVFSQYNLLPFLFCILIYTNDEIKEFFHQNFLIQYEKNYYTKPYQISFKQHNPDMLLLIADKLVSLFNIAREETRQGRQQFDFSNLSKHYWNTEEALVEHHMKHALSLPYYTGHDIDALHHCSRHLRRSFLHQLDAYELTTIIVKLAGEETRLLIEPIVEAIFYMSHRNEVLLEMDIIREYLILDNILKLYKSRRDFPIQLRQALKTYLLSLPGFQEAAPKQNDVTATQHGDMQLKLVRAINSLVNIEQEDVPLLKTEWWEFLRGGRPGSLPNHMTGIQVASQNYFNNSAYKNELWFDEVIDTGGYITDKCKERQFGFLFSTRKNVYLSDMVKSLYDISLNNYELDLAKQFVFAYPRIKKISNELQQIYRENKEN